MLELLSAFSSSILGQTQNTFCLDNILFLIKETTSFKFFSFLRIVFILELNGFFKTKTNIRSIFKKVMQNNNKIICTCGSGISACSLAFSLSVIGKFNWSVYDGSWTEWYLKTKS